jgi:hypothetical protein
MRRARARIVAPLVLVALAAAAAADAAPPPPDHVALGRAFVTRLAAGDFAGAAASFDDVMRAAMPVAQLAEVWQQLTSQVGPFKRQLEARTERRGELVAVLVTCELGAARWDVRVVYRGAQVTGLCRARRWATPPSSSASPGSSGPGCSRSPWAAASLSSRTRSF